MESQFPVTLNSVQILCNQPVPVLQLVLKVNKPDRSLLVLSELSTPPLFAMKHLALYPFFQRCLIAVCFYFPTIFQSNYHRRYFPFPAIGGVHNGPNDLRRAKGCILVHFAVRKV